MASRITKSLSAAFLISSRQTSDTGQERVTSLTYISTSLTVRLSSLSQVGKGCLEPTHSRERTVLSDFISSFSSTIVEIL